MIRAGHPAARAVELRVALEEQRRRPQSLALRDRGGQRARSRGRSPAFAAAPPTAGSSNQDVDETLAGRRAHERLSITWPTTRPSTSAQRARPGCVRPRSSASTMALTCEPSLTERRDDHPMHVFAVGRPSRA